MAYEVDTELEQSTNKVMLIGAGLMLISALIFPLYRFTEPTNRDEAREIQQASQAASGEELFNLNCTACHGLNGEGGTGPALNSQQFLQAATDEQIELLIAVGVPGSQMSAYSQDFSGPLTSQQITALAVYLRSLEDNAPDNPDWRAMIDG